MIEADVVIETGEGDMGVFTVRPDGGPPAPVVIFLMDAPGKRALLHDMARRIASNGYFVLLPNLYYRTTPEFELDFSSKESFERMVDLMSNIGNKAVARDVGALLAHAGHEPAADATRVGLVGYCMSGPFAVWSAAEHRDVVRAAASFYGVRLHVDADDSPHLRLGEITGELYVGAAEHDDYVPLEMIDRFEAAMQDRGVAGRVERYWGTHHGFAFDDRPAYDRRADDRHWAAMLDLFERNLRS
jgi:carboxymethylenebutenolidase